MNLEALYLFLLCWFAFVAADINEVRKNAIKNLDTQIANLKKLAEDTSVEAEKRQDNIKIITKHNKEFGDGIYEKINFEVSRTAKSAYMLANLLRSPNEVFRCIEFRERESMDNSDRYYSDKFLIPGRDYETKSINYQRDLIKSWKDDYYKAYEKYLNIYKKSVSDIQQSKSETSILSIVKQFDQTSNQMAEIIVSIHPNMAKLHIQILKIFNQLVNNLQQFAKYRVEETAKAIDKCFPAFYQKEFFIKSFLF